VTTSPFVSKQEIEHLELKKKLLEEKQKQLDLVEGLPHLYGWKWYEWAYDFFTSRNKVNLLCAANQISKSSTQIRKCIEWAGNTKLWGSLWRQKPNQFWYLYPTSDVATAEFETKWSQFLPTGAYKDHPTYGWKAEYDKKQIKLLKFNSGVTVYFKTYSQNVSHLQSGTVFALFCDEELPTELYDELMFRLTASEGYFHMVFTATLGQDYWRRAMEPGASEEEVLPHAWKKQVSMYECMFYTDGTESHWTEEKITEVIGRCKNKQEVLKRVWGKFVRDEGRKYPSFDIGRHFKQAHPLPENWKVYAGIDIGSGGRDGHPAAIVFIACSPDYRQGRVIKAWRGDGQVTTAGDILTKYNELKKLIRKPIELAYYDYASKDFFTIASRAGESFIAADKSHERGEEVINSLFKNNMMFLYDDEETRKLGAELHTLSAEGDKRKMKDDLADAFRYSVTQIPWDFSNFFAHTEKTATAEPEKKLSAMEQQIKDRREGFHAKRDGQDLGEIGKEFAEWNSAYGE
jgi:hypothetical protein